MKTDAEMRTEPKNHSYRDSVKPSTDLFCNSNPNLSEGESLRRDERSELDLDLKLTYDLRRVFDELHFKLDVLLWFRETFTNQGLVDMDNIYLDLISELHDLFKKCIDKK